MRSVNDCTLAGAELVFMYFLILVRRGLVVALAIAVFPVVALSQAGPASPARAQHCKTSVLL